MQLIANAQTIDRLVEEGVDFSKAFHVEFEKDPTGPEAQFLRGEFSGWRSCVSRNLEMSEREPFILLR